VKSLIQLGYKEKQLEGVIFGSKLTLNHPYDKKKKEEEEEEGLRSGESTIPT